MPNSIVAKLGVGLVVLVLAVSACQNSSPSASSSGGSSNKPLIICVCGPTSDPFFGAYKLGNDIAEKDLGVNVDYSAAPNENQLAADYVPLIRAAIARKPAALIVGDFIPSAFDPAIKDAVAAGIPVVLTSVGADSWQSDGAIGFVGENPALMGIAAAKQELQAGATNGLCVNHLPGAGTLQARCDAYIATLKSAGVTASEMEIPVTENQNDQQVTQDIVGYLRSHTAVDAIFTLGPTIAVDAIAARTQTGRSKIVVGTTDISAGDLAALKSGSLSFICDQQPFLQGYYGVQIAAQYVLYRVAPAGQVSTGPFVITQQNVGTVEQVMQHYPGIRGAS